VVNKAFGVGGGEPPATLRGIRHIVKSFSDPVITVEGNQVVVADDDWIGFKVKFITGTEAGNSFAITDSVAGTTDDTLTVSGSPSAAADDKFEIVDGSDNQIDFVQTGAADKQGVFQDTNAFDVTNEVLTPDLSGVYTGGLCENWTKEGAGSVTENTDLDFVTYGTKSQLMGGSADGHGVSQIVNTVVDEYYSIFVLINVQSAATRLDVVAGTKGYRIVAAAGTGLQTLKVENVRAEFSTITISVKQDGAGTMFTYLDSAQVSLGEIAQEFTSNQRQVGLWNDTHDFVKEKKDGRVTIVGRFVDLNRIDPVSFPFSKVNIGDKVKVIDDDLGIDQLLTVAELNDNIFQPERSQTIISNV